MKKDKIAERAKANKVLEEKFKKLGKAVKAPDDLKKEVFSTLDTLNLLADIADLFTGKFAMTEIEALGIPDDKEEILTPKKQQKINGTPKKMNDLPPTTKDTPKE